MPQMKNKRFVALCALCLVGAGITAALAQRGRFRGDYDNVGRNGVPEWEIEPGFPGDVFTFVRIKYDSYGGYGRGGGVWRSLRPLTLLPHQLRDIACNLGRRLWSHSAVLRFGEVALQGRVSTRPCNAASAFRASQP